MRWAHEQVFVYHEGDHHYRNRLTHTIEVARLGRTLARALGANVDFDVRSRSTRLNVYAFRSIRNRTSSSEKIV